MNCHEWQSQWQAMLDGDAPRTGDAVWRAHAKYCPSCRELQETAERLLSSLRSLPRPAPPRLFADSVVTAFQREQGVLRHQRLWLSVGAVLAAAMVVFGMARLYFHPAADSKSEIAASAVPPLSLESQFADARSATVDLGRRVARDTVRQASLFLPSADRWSGFGSDTAAEQPTTVPVREMGRTVSDSLEPVTSSTRRAFHMFRRLLPPTEIDKPNS